MDINERPIDGQGARVDAGHSTPEAEDIQSGEEVSSSKAVQAAGDAYEGAVVGAEEAAPRFRFRGPPTEASHQGSLAKLVRTRLQ